MYTHISLSGTSLHSLRERRLCFVERIEPQVALGASNEMARNTQLNGALRMYEDPLGPGQQPLLNDAEFTRSDKAMFRALIFSGMLKADVLPTRFDNIDLNGLHVLDPLGLARPDATTGVLPDAMTVGNSIVGLLNRDQIARLFPGIAENDAVRIGQRYLDMMEHGRSVLNGPETRTPTISNLRTSLTQERNVGIQLLVQLPIEAYRNAKSQLDDILRTNGIAIPREESGDRPGLYLNRRDYLALIAVILKDGAQPVRDAAALPGEQQARVTVLRGLYSQPPYQDQSERLLQFYGVTSLGVMGSAEALREIGDITTHIGALRTYLSQRTVPASTLQPGTRRPVVGPNNNVFNTRLPQLQQRNVPAITTPAIPSASSWVDNPVNALNFFKPTPANPTGLLPDTPGNRKFMESLQYYVANNWVVRTGDTPPPWTDKGTKALLQLLANEFTAFEQVERTTKEELEQSKKELTLTQQFNGLLESTGDILSNWRENKLEAALIVGSAIVLIPMIWRFLRQPRTLRGKIFMAGGIGALLFGIIQQRRQGHAYWDSAYAALKDAYKQETGQPLQEQSSITFWSREIGRNSLLDKKCLRLVQNAQADEVIRFYDAVESNPRANHRLPPSMKANVGNMFGEMEEKDIALAVHSVLKSFFANRGAMLAAQNIAFPGQINNAAEQGKEYFRMRYASNRIVSSLLDVRVLVNGQYIDCSFVRTSTRQQIEKLADDYEREHPGMNMREHILMLRALYEAEQATPDGTRDCPMWQALYLEGQTGMTSGDPMQPRGRLASMMGLIRTWADNASFRLGRPFSAPPQETAREEILLANGSERHNLFTSLLANGKFVAQHSVHNSLPDAERAASIQKDWQEFLARVPVSEEAKKLLLAEVTRLEQDTRGGPPNGLPFTVLLNQLERWKYHLLIAASRDRDRVSKEIVSRINTDPTVTRNFHYWLTWVPSSIAERQFPKIDTLDDVIALFDENARGPGQVPTREIWKRIFPRWQASGFDILTKRLTAMREELAVLRRAPYLFAGPGGGNVPENAAVLMEEHIAHDFAKEILRAMHSTHGTTSIADPEGQRYVTDIEKGNLERYFNTVYSSIMPVGIRDRFRRLSDKAHSVANQVTVDGQPGLDVRFLSNGQVVIAMARPSTGFADSIITDIGNRVGEFAGNVSNSRFMMTSEFNSSFPTANRLFVMRSPNAAVVMDVREFEGLDAAAIGLRWKNWAVSEKRQSIQSQFPGPLHQIQARVDAAAPHNDVIWRFGNPPRPEGRTLIPNFLTAENRLLRDKYEVWSATGTPADPLQF